MEMDPKVAILVAAGGEMSGCHVYYERQHVGSHTPDGTFVPNEAGEAALAALAPKRRAKKDVNAGLVGLQD